MTITITRGQRDALCAEVLTDLTGVGDIYSRYGALSPQGPVVSRSRLATAAGTALRAITVGRTALRTGPRASRGLTTRSPRHSSGAVLALVVG